MSSSDSVTTTPDAARMPRKAGHVYKRSGVVRSWKLLFFSLEGSVLYYFKREGDAQPKGIVVLSGCDVRVTKDKKFYSFRISHPKTSKVYDLATTLPSRTEDWIEALQLATRFVPNSSMLPPSMGRSESTSSSGDGSASNTNSSRGLRSASSSSNLRGSLVGLTSMELDAIRLSDESEHHAVIPEQYRVRLESLMAEFVLQARDDAPGWKLQSEKLDVKAYVRSASRLGSFKGVGVIQQHPYVVLKLILEISRRHLFDPQLLAKQRLQLYDQHTFIDHLVYKAVFPASPRDFVNITHWRVLKDGSIIVIAASVERDDLCPKREPKIVRAEAIMGGFLLIPSDDYTSVTAKYITKADIKSGIPQAMQTKLFIKQAFLIDGIRKALEDEELDGRTASSSYPRVTNRTHFALSVTDPDHDDDDDGYDDDVSDSEHSNEQQDDHTAAVVSSSEYGTPTVPAEYNDMIEKAIARMDAEIDDEASWVFHSEKHGVKAYTKLDGSLTACKGVGFLPYHPRLIFGHAIDASERSKLDPQLAFGGSLKQIDAQTSIDYLEYKSVFVVAGRDFCNLAHWRVLPNGTIVIVAQSIEDHALCPLKEPKVVRGEVHLACWKIVPNATYTGADVTFMAKTDLKGNIPARIAGKAASEQPFLLLRIADALKKRKDAADVIAQGKMVNLGAAGAATSSSPTTNGSSRRTSRAASSSVSRQASNGASSKSVSFTKASSGKNVSQHHVEPEPETRSAAKHSPTSSHGAMKTSANASHAAPSTENTQIVLATHAAQFVVALLALKTVGLPSILHYGAIVALLVYFAVQVHLGPCNMSPRRKLMIASFGPPDSGMILGTLEMDVSKTKQFIAAKRASSGDHITITHVVLRALGVALGNAPSVNGHIVFGNYYPAPTVDISCLVAVDGGKDLGVCRLPEADKMDLKAICARVQKDATKLRSGKDKEQDDRNQLLRVLPTYIVRPLVNVIGWLGGAVGIRVKPVGVERYMFGTCMVTSVGMMGLDLAFSPLTPYAQTPMLVTVGAIKDKAVVVDGQVVVRPILTITTTIDHRYVDGSEAARMASNVKKYIEDPSLLESAK